MHEEQKCLTQCSAVYGDGDHGVEPLEERCRVCNFDALLYRCAENIELLGGSDYLPTSDLPTQEIPGNQLVQAWLVNIHVSRHRAQPLYRPSG